MKAVFIDLDGTLLKGNSMKIFMLRLPLYLLRKGALTAVFDVFFRIALRIMHIYDHRRMKWHITGIAKKYLNDESWRAMADYMLRNVNLGVKRISDSKKTEGFRLWLATAAPEEYSIHIARSLGFDGLCATKFTPKFSDYIENRKELKLESIQKILLEHDLVMDLFITDHKDDLPTAMAYPNNTILVNPSKHALLDMPFARVLSM